MPKITCTTSCYFSEENKLFNKDQTYNVDNPTWAKMQKVGMAKYFDGVAAPAAKPAAPAAPATPENQGK